MRRFHSGAHRADPVWRIRKTDDCFDGRRLWRHQLLFKPRANPVRPGKPRCCSRLHRGL